MLIELFMVLVLVLQEHNPLEDMQLVLLVVEVSLTLGSPVALAEEFVTGAPAPKEQGEMMVLRLSLMMSGNLCLKLGSMWLVLSVQ